MIIFFIFSTDYNDYPINRVGEKEYSDFYN